jgi:hypothetical protein
MQDKTPRLRWREVNRFDHLRELPVYRTRVPGGYLVTRVFFVPEGGGGLAEVLIEEAKAIAQRDYDARRRGENGDGAAKCS